MTAAGPERWCPGRFGSASLGTWLHTPLWGRRDDQAVWGTAAPRQKCAVSVPAARCLSWSPSPFCLPGWARAPHSRTKPVLEQMEDRRGQNVSKEHAEGACHFVISDFIWSDKDLHLWARSSPGKQRQSHRVWKSSAACPLAQTPRQLECLWASHPPPWGTWFSFPPSTPSWSAPPGSCLPCVPFARRG